mgnify:CR=1 FL=1
MNEQTRELIAIGVSIGAHCQPCLEFHLAKARELGVPEGEVLEAIEVGYMVEKGASTAMRKHVESLFRQEKSQSGPCCSGGASSCCG